MYNITKQMGGCCPDEFHFMGNNHPRWETLWGNILHDLQSYSMILSNEVFWYREDRQLLNEAVKKWEHVKVLVYLRRQDLYLESRYMSFVRSGETKDFDEWIDTFLNGDYKIPDTEHREDISYF